MGQEACRLGMSQSHCLDAQHGSANSKRRLYGRGCNRFEYRRRVTRSEFGIVREDRTQDAARVFDAHHSEAIWYVRHGPNTFLALQEHLRGQSLIILKCLCFHYAWPECLRTLPTLRQRP